MDNSAPLISTTEQTFPITLRSFNSSKPFDQVVFDFEKQLGRFDQAFALSSADPPTAVKAMEGELGLMIIHVLEMGALLPSLAASHTLARQYLVGNPNIASNMAKFDPLAALYAPPRVLIYTTEAGTCISYDQPSSVFGRLNSNDIMQTAIELDQKFETLAMRSLAK